MRIIAWLPLIVSVLFQPVSAQAAERVLLGGGTPRASAQISGTEASALQQLQAQAAESGRVSVIVGLRVPFAPEGELNADTASRQRQEIAAAAAVFRSAYAAAIRRDPASFRSYDAIPFVAIEVTAEELNRLASDPQVVSIAPNAEMGPSVYESTLLIGADLAKLAGFVGNGQTVAILDSGIDKNHVFLNGRVVSEACYSSGGTGALCPGGATSSTAEGSGVPCTLGTSCQHGTHLAGIVAGTGGIGTGVARLSTLVSIQVFSRTSSSAAAAFEADVIAGLNRVLALKDSYNIAAALVSLSGTNAAPANTACDSQSPAMKAAIDNLRSAGIATIVASGNGASTSKLSFPACISSAVSVGAVSDAAGKCQGKASSPMVLDQVTCYSNTATNLSLLAPGSFILSSVSSATSNSQYGTLEGTSMAAAHVAGAWALLKEKAPPGTTVDQILSALQTTGKPILDARGGVNITKPRIAVKAALDSFPARPRLSVLTSSAANGSGIYTVKFADGTSTSCQVCSLRLPPNTVVTVSGTPNKGSKFVSFLQPAACTGRSTCTLTLTSDTVVTAAMSLETYAVNYRKIGSEAGTVTLSAPGSSTSCEGECGISATFGTGITATAAPGTGGEFAGWSGPCTNSAATCAFTVSGDTQLSAEFRRQQVQLTFVRGSGLGGATILVGGEVNSQCNAGCGSTFDYGTTVAIVPTPDTGYDFTGWAGACTGTGACTIKLTANSTVTANFTPKTYTLNYVKDGNGLGSVSILPVSGAPNCTTSCSRSYVHGTAVTLTATPTIGSEFLGWSGGGCSGTGPCQLTLTAATTVTAQFRLQSVALAYDQIGSGSVTFIGGPLTQGCTQACSRSYDFGTLVLLDATPATGYQFDGWEGACAGKLSCTLQMNAAKSVKAMFSRIGFDLSYVKAGKGAGMVTFSPSGGLASCAQSCTNRFAGGDEVTLTATPADDSVFDGWSAGPCSGTGPCRLTMSAAARVTANFSLKRFTLDYSTAGAGTGRVTFAPAGGNASCAAACTNSYEAHSTVTLTARPDKGMVFAGWSGDCEGQDSCVVSMEAAKAVTARFMLPADSYPLTYSAAGTGPGRVVLTPEPLAETCGNGACVAHFAANTPVTLTAIPELGGMFTAWSKPCKGRGACKLVMKGPATVMATFKQVAIYTVRTQQQGTGSGAITLTPADPAQQCTAGICVARYSAGTLVRAKSVPDTNAVFDGWVGGSCKGKSVCTLTMSANREAIASFRAIPALSLQYTKAGSGGGTVSFTIPARTESCDASCVRNYGAGTVVKLSAVADGLSSFVGWSGECSGKAACVVKIDAAKSVTATFNAASTAEVKYVPAGVGSGTLTMTAFNRKEVCTGPCTRSFVSSPPTTVTFTVKADPGFVFTGWGGSCSGNRACSVMTNAARTILANFAPAPAPAAQAVRGKSAMAK